MIDSSLLASDNFFSLYSDGYVIQTCAAPKSFRDKVQKGVKWETKWETKGKQSGRQREPRKNHFMTGCTWETTWETKPGSCRDKISHKSKHNWRHSGRQSKPGENQFVTGFKWETKVVNKVGRKVIRAKIIL